MYKQWIAILIQITWLNWKQIVPNICFSLTRFIELTIDEISKFFLKKIWCRWQWQLSNESEINWKIYYSLWPTAMEADVKRFTFKKWINEENHFIKKTQTFLVFVDLERQFSVFGIYRQAMNFYLLQQITCHDKLWTERVESFLVSWSQFT